MMTQEQYEHLVDKIRTLKHTRAIRADQIHQHMSMETEILLDAELEGLDAQIEALEEAINQIERDENVDIDERREN